MMKLLNSSACIVLIGLVTSVQSQPTTTVLRETWNGVMWENVEKTTTHHDNQNNPVYALDENWNNTSSSWENKGQISYANNSDGTISQSVIETWDTNTIAFINDTRHSYTYYLPGKIGTHLSEIWLGSSWMNTSKITNTSDANNFLVYTISETWYQGSWQNASQIDYINNGGGTVQVTVSQSWNNNIWFNSQRETYTYNNQDLIDTLLKEGWINGNWVDNVKNIYTYDTNNNLIQEVLKSWNSVSGSWEDNQQIDYSYNSQGWMEQIIVQFWAGITWINTARITIAYFNWSPSSIIIINEEANSIVVYPNPTTDKLILEGDILQENNVEVTLVDLLGKVLLHRTFNTDTSIKKVLDISDLACGVFLFQITSETSNQTVKIIKH